MNDAIPDASPTDVPAAAELRTSPGSMLARRRAERGLSLGDVARHLKYGARQIEALEQDDYPKLPGQTFVRGMIRSYAKLLGLDPAPLLRELERREIPAQVTVDLRAKRIPFPDGSKRSTRVYAVLSGLIVLVAASVIFEWQVGTAPWSFPGSAPAPSPAPAAPAAPAVPTVEAVSPAIGADQAPAAIVQPAGGGEGNQPPMNAAPHSPANTAPAVTPAMQAGPPARVPPPDANAAKARIVLQFQRESWVEIKQADGRVLMSQMNRGGSEQELGGTPPFDVVIGNAPSVRLIYNGQAVDLRPHFKVDVARLVLE